MWIPLYPTKKVPRQGTHIHIHQELHVFFVISSTEPHLPMVSGLATSILDILSKMQRP